MRRNLMLILTGLLIVIFAVGIGSAKTKRSSKAWLGVYLESVDYDISEDYDLSVNYGAFIARVIDDSPAEEAGLKDGDVVIKMDGKKITDSDDLIDFIDDKINGDEITLTIIRDNDEKKLDVTLGRNSSRRWSYNKSPRIIVYSDDDDDHDFDFNFDFDHDFDFDFDDNHGRKYYQFGHNNRYNKNHGYIGVHLSELNKQLGEYFGVKKGRGVLISEVVEDSPAEKAGLKAGDVIIKANDEKVYDSQDLIEIISDLDEGDKVNIKIIRDRKEKEFTIEVADSDDFSDNSYWQYDDMTFHAPELYTLKESLKGLQGLQGLQGLRGLKGLRDIRTPRVRSDYYYSDDLDDLQNEIKQFQNEEMDDLKKEIKTLQKEMKELYKKLDD